MINSIAELEQKAVLLRQLATEIQDYTQTLLRGASDTHTPLREMVTKPSTYNEMIFVILRAAGRPLQPRNVTDEIIVRGWAPNTDRKKLLVTIGGNMSELYRKKKRLSRDEQGYTIKEGKKN